MILLSHVVETKPAWKSWTGNSINLYRVEKKCQYSSAGMHGSTRKRSHLRLEDSGLPPSLELLRENVSLQRQAIIQLARSADI